jgi:hypothetical protein
VSIAYFFVDPGAVQAAQFLRFYWPSYWIRFSAVENNLLIVAALGGVPATPDQTIWALQLLSFFRPARR